MILESALPIDSRTSKNTWANVMGILPEKYELDTFQKASNSEEKKSATVS